jgi:hypothetical protein
MGCFEDYMEFRESVECIMKNRRGHRDEAKKESETASQEDEL